VNGRRRQPASAGSRSHDAHGPVPPRPAARLVLLDAPEQAGTPSAGDRPGAMGDVPEPTVVPARVAGHHRTRPAVPDDQPVGLMRVRFADAVAFERAEAAFGAAPGPCFDDVWGDPATLTVRIVGDVGVETLRAALAVLDTAAITARSLTVHTRELDDVFAAFTGLP
jgi:hypothetical protein